MPSAFRVARDSDGSPAAFQCLCEATVVPAWLLSADPVAATWREHLRANPVPRGQQVLFSVTCWPPTAAKPRRRPTPP